VQTFIPHEIKWSAEKAERLWNYIFQKNPSYYSDLFGKDIINRTIIKTGKLDDKTILDYGCGPAFFIDHFTDSNIRPKKYIGLDFSEESINTISNKRANFDLSGICINTSKAQLEKDSIDVCFLIEVIEHLDDLQLSNTLTTIYHGLKSDGYLVITTPNNENMELMKTMCPECGCIYHKYQHVRTWTKNSLSKYMNKFNFHQYYLDSVTFTPKNMSLKGHLKYFLKKILNKNDHKLFGLFQK